MQPLDLLSQITLPEQSIKKLSFCSSYKAQRVADWASLLRPSQVEKTSALLYAALPEINQLRCTTSTRVEMLECLRPYVQHTITGLGKAFLNQAMPLSEEAQRSVVIAQSLQKHMVDGYCLAVKELSQARKLKEKERELLATCLHRAITGLGLIIMRGLQLYTPAPKGIWLTMHRLFRCADAFELLDHRVNDNIQNKTKLSSIQNNYLRSVLLASAHPDQITQNDISALYDDFCDWAKQARFQLDLSDNSECFLYLNLEADAGPHYKSRANEAEQEQLLLELDLRSITNQIAKQEQDGEEKQEAGGLSISPTVSSALLKHLLNCWGGVVQRRHDRRQTQMSADICIGLSDCLYFANNNQSFEDFINSNHSESELDSKAMSFTPGDAFTTETKHSERPLFRLNISNISQGGYCLEWKGESMLKLQAGDVIGLKELNKRLWQVGVVRWIRQRRHSSLLGIQILSEKIEPCGLAQTYDMGGYSDFMREIGRAHV